MDLAIGMLRNQLIWEDKRQGGKLYKHLRRKKKYGKEAKKVIIEAESPTRRVLMSVQRLLMLEYGSAIGKLIRLLEKI